MSRMVDAYLGVGSNLGDREATILGAIERLRAADGVEVVRVSRLRETEPVGVLEQPKFLNGVILVRTVLAARALLDVCLRIEGDFGRMRSTEQPGGPRTLDLDLLLHGRAIMDEPQLHVPHPRLHERLFVLEPLAELGPHVEHPVFHATIGQLLEQLRSSGAYHGAVPPHPHRRPNAAGRTP